MTNLLSIEYAKLKKLNSLKTILIIYMAVVPLWMIVYSLILKVNPGLTMLFEAADRVYSFPHVWNYTTWSASCFNILLGVSVVIITCNEIHFKTMRQNVIDGLTKRDVILSKFLALVTLATLVTLYTTILAFIFGLIYSGFERATENIHFVFVYYLQTLGYFSVAFLLASVIRKPALSIVLFIFIFPVELIVSLFVPHDIAGFMPLRSMSGLTPSPFERIGALMDAGGDPSQMEWIMPVWLRVITAAIYISLFFSFTYYLLKKRDL